MKSAYHFLSLHFIENIITLSKYKLFNPPSPSSDVDNKLSMILRTNLSFQYNVLTNDTIFLSDEKPEIEDEINLKKN